MNDLIYAGAVVAGAVTLLIEAFRNFNSQTGDHPFSLHPILKEVEVRSLCTPSEVIVGFAVYAALYLLVYAVVLGSAEVYDLLVSASNARTEIGATDNVLLPDSDPSLLSSTNYGKPIFVSALLISFLSIGAVKPIEATMRSLAHRLAGIPRGVYKVIESLRDIRYDDFVNEQPGLLVTKFRAATISLSENKEFAAECKSIEGALATIDYLSEATSDSRRMLYFPLFQMAELTALSAKLDHELADLQGYIDALSKRLQSTGGATPPDMADKRKTLSDLAGLATAARSNTMAVFAVLFVRNNRSIFSQSGTPHSKGVEDAAPLTPMEKTARHIQAKYNAEQNSFAFSMLAACIIGSILTFLLYEKYSDWRLQNDPGVYSEQTPAVRKEIQDAELHNKQVAETKKGETVPVLCPSETEREQCVQDESIRRYRLTQRSVLINWAVWDTLHSGAVVFLSVFFVLVGREVRIEQQSWRTDWKFYQFPFLRLLGMSFLSGIIAVFASAALNFLKLAWDVSFHITQTQVIFLFEQSGGFFALHFGAGLILSFAALVVMDKHKHVSLLSSIFISIAFSITYALYMWILIYVSYGTNISTVKHFLDTFIFSVVPFIFLIVFAVALEITEAGDRREARGTDGQGQGE